MIKRNAGQSETVIAVSPSDPVLKYPQDFSDVDQKRSAPVHKFGNTQLDIPQGEAADALEALRSLIDDDDCAGQGKNVEGNHITVRYGLASDEHAGVASYFSRCTPFEVTLGKTEMFPPSEHSDNAAVIKVPVQADALHKMNSELEQHGQFTAPTFDEYKPHATVAYVKPEAAFKYVGMSLAHGKKFTADSATISKRDGTSLLVKLEGQAVPEDPKWKSLGAGYGNLSGEVFGETQNSLELGPQGEVIFRFDPDQPRDKSGAFSMGNVATFENEKEGTKAFVTKFEGKYHVNVLKANQPYLPAAIYSDKQQAVDKAKELISARERMILYECRSGESIWF